VGINCFLYTSTLLYCAKNANRVITEALVLELFLQLILNLGGLSADIVLCSAFCIKTEEAVQVILTSLYELSG